MLSSWNWRLVTHQGTIVDFMLYYYSFLLLLFKKQLSSIICFKIDFTILCFKRLQGIMLKTEIQYSTDSI